MAVAGARSRWAADILAVRPAADAAAHGAKGGADASAPKHRCVRRCLFEKVPSEKTLRTSCACALLRALAAADEAADGTPIGPAAGFAVPLGGVRKEVEDTLALAADCRLRGDEPGEAALMECVTSLAGWLGDGGGSSASVTHVGRHRPSAGSTRELYWRALSAQRGVDAKIAASSVAGGATGAAVPRSARGASVAVARVPSASPPPTAASSRRPSSSVPRGAAAAAGGGRDILDGSGARIYVHPHACDMS